MITAWLVASLLVLVALVAFGYRMAQMTVAAVFFRHILEGLGDTTFGDDEAVFEAPGAVTGRSSLQRKTPGRAFVQGEDSSSRGMEQAPAVPAEGRRQAMSLHS
jgi:hypothetical protein